MSNTYYLESADQSLVIDIKVPVASGSGLQALVKKTESNQRWQFVPVSDGSPYFYLVSADQGLAVDIKTPVASGSGLQALVKKTESNQQWMSVPVADNSQYFYLVSADQSLVIDIKTPVTSGSALQALVKKTEGNEQWTVGNVAGNSFQPKIAPFQTDIDLSNGTETVTVSGSGYFPGAGLQIQPTFILNLSGSPTTTTQPEPLYVQADLAGNFSKSAPLTSWALSGQAGQFVVNVVCQQLSPNSTSASAQWNGGQFS